MLSLELDLLDRVDFLRADAAARLAVDRKAEFGQFLTPRRIARLMAAMFTFKGSHIRILDPGAGVGSLSAACVSELCSRLNKPESISLTAYEVDPMLLTYLTQTFEICSEVCASQGIRFEAEVIGEDFIPAAVELVDSNLFVTSQFTNFNCAILNPPYKKISSDSRVRQLLNHVGLGATNLYPAFVWLTARLLQDQGELVAITPRSFCNGPYFKEFRKDILRLISLERIHVFDSRKESFKEDEVLQENVILRGIKNKAQAKTISISTSGESEVDASTWIDLPASEVVKLDDPESFIHIVSDDLGREVSSQIASLKSKLGDLKIQVSTGKVVDFRSEEHLRALPEPGTVPLLYPQHFNNGRIAWPKAGKKPNAILNRDDTRELLVPNQTYVLVKRFSSKEERRRLVAVVYEAEIPGDFVAFENHINYFHMNGNGLPKNLAWGLCTFLNSSLLDAYFRQFNGHTQVNATDLRSIQYPTREQLENIGEKLGTNWPGQSEIDALLEEEIMHRTTKNPVPKMKKIKQALEALKELDFPRAQQNERSALTLLALLGLGPKSTWSQARNPLCGITPMMEFFADHYGKAYAPNTRETVRRQTVHQMLDAGLIEANPDDPGRPVNSPKAVYRIEKGALELLQTFGKKEWKTNLAAYLSSRETLRSRYAQERQKRRIRVTVAPNKIVDLSPGGQNILIEKIVEDFMPEFVPSGEVLYIGDTGEKFGYFQESKFEKLGVHINLHGKMPDVVIHHKSKDWLVLVEAVTSHGPVDPKRRSELSELFAASKAGLVFVTAFLDRRTLNQYLTQISWETEVWVAESPTHLIHFNGERFLGPY